RAGARALCRRRIAYLQNALIVGAGEVGQLVARKLLQHHEYGINLVGFVDEDPKRLRAELSHVGVLGGADRIMEYIKTYDVDRVFIAFSRDSEERTVELV